MTDMNGNNSALKQKEKKPFFVTTGFFIDFLMAGIFFLTVSSALMITLCYIQVIKLAYVYQIVPFVMVLVFTVIRRLRLRNFTMILLHGIALVIFIMIFYQITGRNEGGTIFICATLILNIFYSMFQRYKVENIIVKSEGPIFSLVVHAFLTLVLFVFKRTDFLIYITTNAVAIVAFYFIARQLNVFEERYFHTLHSTTQAVNSVRKQNNMTIWIIVGGIVFCVLVLIIFPTDLLVKLIKLLIYLILLGISKLLPDNTGLEKEDTDNVVEMNIEDMHGPAPTWMSSIIGYILLAFICIVFFYLVVSALIELFRNFHHKEQIDKVNSDGAIIDIIEDIDPKKKKSNGEERRDFGTGYEREIRKKYYNAVRKAMRRGVNIKNSSSPNQIKNLMQQKGDRSIAELTSLYESVRYDKKKN